MTRPGASRIVQGHECPGQHPGIELSLVDRWRLPIEAEERITYAGSLDPLYTILLDGGIQAMIIEPFDVPAIAGARLKAQTAILEFDDPPVLHGLVMSRRSLSPAQQQAWRDVIVAMRADGTMRRIFGKYFPADLARQMTQF